MSIDTFPISACVTPSPAANLSVRKLRISPSPSSPPMQPLSLYDIDPNHTASVELECIWNCLVVYKQARNECKNHISTAENAAAARLLMTQRRYVRMQHLRHTASYLSQNRGNLTRHLRELLARRRHMQSSMDDARGGRLIDIIRRICSLDEEIAVLTAYTKPKGGVVRAGHCGCAHSRI